MQGASKHRSRGAVGSAASSSRSDPLRWVFIAGSIVLSAFMLLGYRAWSTAAKATARPGDENNYHMSHWLSERLSGVRGKVSVVQRLSSHTANNNKGISRAFLAHQHDHHRLAIATLLGPSPAQFTQLRHFVGSIHHWHPELPILVYGVGVSQQTAARIERWDNIELITIQAKKHSVVAGSVLKHALHRQGFDYIILADATNVLQFRVDSILELLTKDGVFFGAHSANVKDRGGCLPDVIGASRGADKLASALRVSTVTPHAAEIHVSDVFRVTSGVECSVLSDFAIKQQSSFVHSRERIYIEALPESAQTGGQDLLPSVQSLKFSELSKSFVLVDANERDALATFVLRTGGSRKRLKYGEKVELRTLKRSRVRVDAGSNALTAAEDGSPETFTLMEPQKLAVPFPGTQAASLAVTLRLASSGKFVQLHSTKGTVSLGLTPLAQSATVFRLVRASNYADRIRKRRVRADDLLFAFDDAHTGPVHGHSHASLPSKPLPPKASGAQGTTKAAPVQKPPLPKPKPKKTKTKKKKKKPKNRKKKKRSVIAHKFTLDAFDDELDKEETVHIACLIPTVSPRGVGSVEQTPLFKIFLPSFKRTVKSIEQQAKDNMKFRYTIYLGYDVGDRLLDSDAGRAKLNGLFKERTKGYPFELKGSKHSGMKGAPCWLWNALADQAYHDGAQYFYQLNDDIQFKTRGWARLFVKLLRRNRIYPDVGVTGPFDNGRILAQSFVGRPHFTIFNTYYPRVFKNWYSDDWITQVYTPEHCFRPKGPRVLNTNAHGTRYSVQSSAEGQLAGEVRNGKAKIAAWIAEQKKKNKT